MENIGAINAAFAGDFYGVVARLDGSSRQCAVSVHIYDRPLFDFVVGEVELQGLSSVGIAALQQGLYLVADVDGADLHGHGTLHRFVVVLGELVENGVHADVGERGVLAAVRAISGCGVAHADIRRADGQRNRVRLAVVLDVEAFHAVIDLPLGNRHGRGAFCRHVTFLFEQELNGICADFGERGVCLTVPAVHRVGVEHGHTRRADIQRN